MSINKNLRIVVQIFRFSLLKKPVEIFSKELNFEKVCGNLELVATGVSSSYKILGEYRQNSLELYCKLC